MIRWRLIIEYDGRGFCGWQRQAKDTTVQQVIETAIHSFSGETVTLHVAGRTDAGVHARAQVAHFDLEKKTSPDEIFGALNFYMRSHCAVILKVEEASPDFHARFDARERSYRYLLINRPAPLALNKGKAWHFPAPLSLAPMQEAAKLLIGHHDFSTFRAQHCQATSPLRTLDEMTVEQIGDMFVFKLRARSFLYHQVRNIVGTLTLVGTGKWSVERFDSAFRAANRAQGGPTAPPEGLYFWGVEYKNDPETN